jgi:hypothetical protein
VVCAIRRSLAVTAKGTRKIYSTDPNQPRTGLTRFSAHPSQGRQAGRSKEVFGVSKERLEK